MSRFARPASEVFLEAFNRNFRTYFHPTELTFTDIRRDETGLMSSTFLTVNLGESSKQYRYQRLSLAVYTRFIAPYLPVSNMSNDDEALDALKAYFGLQFDPTEVVLSRSVEPNLDMSVDMLITPVADNPIWYEGVVVRLAPENHLGRFIRIPLLADVGLPGVNMPGIALDGGEW